MSEYERRRIDAEIKAGLPVKSYFCRECRAEVSSKGIPAGWFSLKTIPGGEGPHATGLFCSLPCLSRVVRDMERR